jgi:adenylosuccinate synthase
MTTLVALGAQWGDEGKGKLVDWLAPKAQLVVRFHGGNNAGHTLVVDGEQTVLHVVPAGVLDPSTINLIGPGVVVDPAALLTELSTLEARGVLRDPSRVRVSGRAHVILDWHLALDKAREEAAGGRAIGTTGRGIGPAYEDKVTRRGIRIADLLDPPRLRDAITRLAEQKNFELVEYYKWEPVDGDALYEKCLEWGRQLEPYVDHTTRVLDRAMRAGKNVLFEGAQGTFLDIDHGTYPYVTSSNCVAGAVCAGAGIGPTRVDRVLGITKAYTTRVGGGPFPTEETGDMGERLREAGAEFGATTGRPRRCGWLDAVGRHGERLHGAGREQARHPVGPGRAESRYGLPRGRQARRGVPHDPRRDRMRRARLRDPAGLDGRRAGLPRFRRTAAQRPRLRGAHRSARGCAGGDHLRRPRP